MTDLAARGTRRVETPRSRRWWCTLAGLALLVVACGKESSDPGQGTGGGGSAAGKSGHAGSSSSVSGAGGSSVGGAGGSGPVGEGGVPNGGSTSQGGDVASSGQGGEAGGAEPAVAECEENADCFVLDDCCSCSAVSGAASPGSCDKVCIQSACAARGLEGTRAVCEKKRCVFELSCDRSLVTCKAATPSCPAGMVPSVLGTCWAPCVPASDCVAVTDCDDCAAGEVCVNGNDSLTTRHCVGVAAECAAEPSCACTNACSFQCSDADGISCYCINC